MKARAHAALSAKGPLEPFDSDPVSLGPQQVDVRVTHCGIYHTDSALVDDDYGFTQYPLVPGHEAVGVVAAVGHEALGSGWASGPGSDRCVARACSASGARKDSSISARTSG
jgi:uncharacterized zinc-type alcohol dehydrogenase-like protein